MNDVMQVPRRLLKRGQLQLERLRWASYYRAPQGNLEPALHLREAAAWLVRAQDAGNDRGVAYGVRFGEGFDLSYPETTGYIIPTFLKLADHYHDPEFRERAIQMGDWEIAVQMDCGAVMGGKYSTHPTPAVFNTGQVLLGWAALFHATGEKRFLDACRRATDWLLEMQEPEGSWIRGNSSFAVSESTVYNVKAAWGLCEAGIAGGWDDAVQGAVRNAEFAVSKQSPNGWFADCCLGDAQRPLLHTLAYSMQGLVGIGRLTGRTDFIDAATRMADSLIDLMSPDGFLPGRIDATFQGAVDWCCLTGTAQTSIVWSYLYRETNSEKYLAAAHTANRYLMAHHDISNEDPGIRGGIPGSWPVWGEYGRFRILNWATNFFADALLLELQEGK